ncbi:hypothetical protein BXT89_05630 [Halopseudomonas pachastrellae]|uniref:Uncharacterized protein n=1 Tax=Halopseudomonas pachastrellae TaxID=254161 RepID=A0A1S8DIW5_9GAMM|nr:hypothetical protein [Halopseudomonas pachastrellae]MAB41229.1 hypothetical protein [Pseudomonadales bacterium]MEE3158287.1 hypothetical protein [Pseudomonadota bacterium]HCB44456.1 hypothetical protein [Pseudomonas sp.]MAG68361.1 hypothetical protein [Pseudomonadales bacterium]ONM44809.1 hypothetical protein BXT89_05630 [Halopseudomonas pachastrellae]|tara:strand:+ start:511 stop:708 length:198 start_codon:yes stop_codon:yes gene_type:complete
MKRLTLAGLTHAALLASDDTRALPVGAGKHLISACVEMGAPACAGRVGDSDDCDSTFGLSVSKSL